MLKYLDIRLLLLIAFPTSSVLAQENFLRQYAGSYYHLPFGEEKPTTSSEKIILTVDGKFTSTSYPKSENGIVSVTSVKKLGTWKASEGIIELSYQDKTATRIEFKLDVGLFLSSNTYLEKIFISNPIFLRKYAGSFYLFDEREESPSSLTTKIYLTADGKCTIVEPVVDENGTMGNPTKYFSNWKANQDALQVLFKGNGEDKFTQFDMTQDVFRSKNLLYLKRIPPPAPPNPYLKVYAGTYQMLTDGIPATPEMDQYVMTPDGKCKWTLFTTVNPDGTISKTPVIKDGTWTAREGYIRLTFTLGDFDMSSNDLIPDFYLKNGVFRNGNIYLKKLTPQNSEKQK